MINSAKNKEIIEQHQQKEERLKMESVDPYQIPFFFDFMLFLKRLNKEPIKRTSTGAISLSNIQGLISEFKEQEQFEEYRKFSWRIHRADEFQFLQQIQLIAEAMFLVYKRKGLLLLSKNGQGFLNNLESSYQFREMVLHYWYRFNWGYFFYFGNEINGKNLAEVLQKHQNIIWKALLAKGENWNDYKQFCQALYTRFHLEDFFKGEADLENKLQIEVERALFRYNLCQFGLIEIKEEQGKSKWDKQIINFRSTPLGVYIFAKALNENYL